MLPVPYTYNKAGQGLRKCSTCYLPYSLKVITVCIGPSNYFNGNPKPRNYCKL